MDEEKVTERILDRTVDRIFSGGFSGFTMDDVASDAGVSKKTLYRLLPSRNKLIITAVERQVNRVKRRQEAIIADASLSYCEKLNAMLTVVSEVISRVNRQTLKDLARLHPEVWEVIRERRMLLLKNMTRILEEGREAGEIRTDIPANFIALYFQTMVDALISPRTAAEADMSPSDLMSSTLTLFFEGAATTKGGAA